ncbi:MAG TPA: 2,3-dihydro-2,3-dihydroxybenzoate dehydrogenase [Pseudonocardiaceae bacterium]|nr:2,3-dihydro-2,3-dihydroxybenzoate dehydrogenase [Pseudonocardiaceae bacterium]
MADTQQVVLVTGAGQGIGAAVARTLAGEGAIVAAADANIDAVRGTVDALIAAGHSALAYELDVTDVDAVETTVAKIEATMAPIDVLVNVAGVLRTGSVIDMTDAEWSQIFAVNVLGVLHVSRAVARRMRETRSGVVITVGSNAAAVPRMSMAAYCASKAASTSLTKCLGLELAEYGIRCNIVAPGSTDTPMLSSMWADDYGPTEVVRGDAGRYRVGIPLRKLATPEDIADAVAFLASDRAGHITMQELYVDGGAALGR